MKTGLRKTVTSPKINIFGSKEVNPRRVCFASNHPEGGWLESASAPLPVPVWDSSYGGAFIEILTPLREKLTGYVAKNATCVTSF